MWSVAKLDGRGLVGAQVEQIYALFAPMLRASLRNRLTAAQAHTHTGLRFSSLARDTCPVRCGAAAVIRGVRTTQKLLATERVLRCAGV